MATCEFLRPETVDEALGLLQDDGAIALGGGTAVVLLMKERLLTPRRLVWLGRIADLRGIHITPAGSVRIGATTTLEEIARSGLLRDRWPAVAGTASLVGNVRIRTVATLGGHLAHADPSQDLPPLLLALGATIHLRTPQSPRALPLARFLTGFLETALETGELVTAVEIPPLPPGARATYVRFTPASQEDFPTVAVAAALHLADDGTVTWARVALGGAAPTAVLVDEAARLLVGSRPTPQTLDAAAAAAERAADPWDDHRGSARYKRAMVRVWTRRCLDRLLRPESPDYRP